MGGKTYRIMKIEITPRFQIVTPDEGYIFTEYHDGQDIKEYSSFSSCYCPLNCDLKHLREITVDEDTVLCELRDKAIENDNAKEHIR
jgi:hypothetical protein